ncbi:MAG: hypothetical protein GXO10_06380 [Crenarchaeota archaeon]|nr:hypothetical protein [Thermoproteota archaeon]
MDNIVTMSRKKIVDDIVKLVLENPDGVIEAVNEVRRMSLCDEKCQNILTLLEEAALKAKKRRQKTPTLY